MLPRDIDLITDYYVSITMFELKQKLDAQFFKTNNINHLKSFHETTHTDGKFSYKFALSVINYMNKHEMFI